MTPNRIMEKKWVWNTETDRPNTVVLFITSQKTITSNGIILLKELCQQDYQVTTIHISRIEWSTNPEKEEAPPNPCKIDYLNPNSRPPLSLPLENWSLLPSNWFRIKHRSLQTSSRIWSSAHFSYTYSKSHQVQLVYSLISASLMTLLNPGSSRLVRLATRIGFGM